MHCFSKEKGIQLCEKEEKGYWKALAYHANATGKVGDEDQAKISMYEHFSLQRMARSC
jgi:hypothetical protein